MLYFDFINPYFVYAIFVLFTAFSIYAIFTYKKWFRKNRNLLFISVAILLTWTQFARYIVVYLNGDFVITESLPFFMCRISVVVYVYYAYTRDKRVHSFLFYWGALGIAGVLYPNGPISNIENLTEAFFIDHYLLTIIPFYLVAHEGYKPVKKDMYGILLLMTFILSIFVPINYLLGSDYFYLSDQSIFGVLVPNAPVWLFILVHVGASYIFFNFYNMWFSQKKIESNEQVVA